MAIQLKPQNAGGLEKLSLGGNPVKLSKDYQLPPEALWYKPVLSSRRNTQGFPLPLLVLMNGNYPSEWYREHGFKPRPANTYIARVDVYGEPHDNWHYEVLLR